MSRVLIFAQAPPPVHGQSVMVGHLLEGLRALKQSDLAAPTGLETSNAPVAYSHINPQISADLGDIGLWRLRKLALVFKFIGAAIRARFAMGLDTFYFVPAPAKRAAMYRDWVVLFLCRPFFRRLVLHWHCIGQPAFVQSKLSAPERLLARLLYGNAALSICLSNYSRLEAAYFSPENTVVIPNGIPDPAANFDRDIWPERQQRAELLIRALSAGFSEPTYYEVLFLSGRMTPKGLFDAMAAVTLANQKLAVQQKSLRLRLTVAGEFSDETERLSFESASRSLDETRVAGATQSLAIFAGWADEEKKGRLFRAADCFIFPTTYPAESFGLVLAEAMAHGCAVVTTRWQAVPEVLPGGHPGVIEPHDIEGMAGALLQAVAEPVNRVLRDYFLARFTSDRFARDMVAALSDPVALH